MYAACAARLGTKRSNNTVLFARSALPVAAALAVLLSGVPLSVAGLLCAAGIVYAAVALPPLEWRWSRWLALGFLILIVVGLWQLSAASAPPVGLKASYFSKPGAAERSTDFAWLQDATRIDPSLDLRGEGFPVHFFNDATRFNFGTDVQPGRDQLPFSVRWQGFLNVASDGERRFVVESSGPAQVWLDDVPLAEPDSTRFVSSGLRALRVEYTRPEARVPKLRLSWQRMPGGALEVVAGNDVRWEASAAGAELSRMLRASAEAALAVLTVAWIAFGVRAARSGGLTRAALGSVPLVFLLHGMLLEAPLAGRATILSGLDDWLIYESSARDILLNGPLMDGGQGHATPFYGQPLYPYLLALAHWLTGEGLFGPLALQFAALGLVVVGTAVLARRAFGSRLDGLVALACVWGLLQLEAEHFKVARQLFNENLYMPLVMASLIGVVSVARHREPARWWQGLLLGALFGLTAISRSQFLLFIPFGLFILLLAWRWRGAPAMAAIIAGTIIVIAPVTARNWVVSGQFVPIASSGGASLLEFHRPPPGLIDQDALQKDPLFEVLHLDAQTRTVVAFMRADPGGYLATLQPLAAHSVGLQGRNDPGIYWPLLVTTLLYVASFGLKRTRRLRVWPIHAFVGTHLLVLMLFEADTYGYRLVMPMYAPMAAVAGQVVLEGVRDALRVTRYAFSAQPNAQRATRYAQLGWSLIVIAALGWQGKGLAEIWPQRDAALHGLGGPAAVAAATADRVAADAIYVASIDGTPRRFGAGNLTGLRYPWFKWFDATRSLPLPPAASTAVYMLSELDGHTLAGDLVGCLGAPDASGQQVVTGLEARRACVGDWAANTTQPVSFENVARIEALKVPDSVEAGEHLETRILWQPLVAHPDPYVVSLQLDDPAAGDGTLWGNGTLELYPAAEWQTDEAVLSRIPVATDFTAAPQRYRLTVGMAQARANASPALSVWQGARTDRVPVSSVTLTPGSGATPQALPADMRPVEGPPFIGGGLELIGARPLPEEAAIGGPLRVGLLWRAARDAPDATQVTLRLMRDNGDVVQDTQLPLLGGRLLPSVLHAGNVVRDEQSFVIGARVPPESLSVEVALGGSAVRLGSVKMTGRAHQLDTASDVRPEATFGDSMQLLSDALEPTEGKANAKLSVKLRWRSAAEMPQAYKVFVHVLDPPGEHVVAQRDAEPQDGRAPTTGWVVGEVIDDEYAITLPGTLPAGDYPVEVGVYDVRSGDRLRLADGDNRFVLSTRLNVR
jgi:4-amino-4-deoxy-L-arabinose transferase-like glycosyltransferase